MQIIICIFLYLCMIYQLPNGKIIDIPIDEVLNMTNERLQYYMSLNAGIDVYNPIADIDIFNSSDIDEEDASLEPNYDADEIYKLYYPDDYTPDVEDDYMDLE